MVSSLSVTWPVLYLGRSLQHLLTYQHQVQLLCGYVCAYVVRVSVRMYVVRVSGNFVWVCVYVDLRVRVRMYVAVRDNLLPFTWCVYHPSSTSYVIYMVCVPYEQYVVRRSITD